MVPVLMSRLAVHEGKPHLPSHLEVSLDLVRVGQLDRDVEKALGFQCAVEVAQNERSVFRRNVLHRVDANDAVEHALIRYLL